jgi:flagellar biosynthesis/type III secretory pathway chaperone
MNRSAEKMTLIDLLGIERDCCSRLRAVLEAERKAAAEYDLSALHACLRQREAVQAEWRRVAEIRLRRPAGARQEIAQALAKDPALANAVRGLRSEIAAVRRAQGVNQALVRAALAQVTDLLQVVRRASPESRYDGRACLTGSLPFATGARWSA